jgi:SAM-dependent methyltransferase
VTIATNASAALPLRLGKRDDLNAMRALLADRRFDEATICDGLGLDSLARVGTVTDADVAALAARRADLACLVQLLVLGRVVSRADAERLLGQPLLEAFAALDVTRPIRTPAAPDGLYASVMLYPVAGMLIASDRHDNPDGSPFVAPPDVVFPAIFTGTYRFLRMIAKSAAEDALDLCSGTGIGAFVLSRAVRRVVAADLTERCTHFARFNRLLNDCDNVEVVQGDLYEPAAGRQFDRIVAHPPYVPALSQSQIFRDAGDTGEAILQRIVSGLPRFLRPGGTFYCVAAGWDTAEAPLEERIRGWLGPPAAEFDLILAHDEELSPRAVAQRLSEKSLGGEADALERFEQQFARAALAKNVYGAIVLHRVSGANRDGRVTLRCRSSERTDGAALEAALRWHRGRVARQAAGTYDAALLDSTLRLGPELQVKTLHTVEAGELVQDSIVLESERPFLSSTKIEPWMLSLVAAFARGRRAADVYAGAREQHGVPEDFEVQDFVALVTAMIERGYLEIDGAA